MSEVAYCKFPHNPVFDREFDKIPGLVWYPYVGSDFGRDSKRIMVYAHNIPIKSRDIEEKRARWTPKGTWTTTLEEYAYDSVPGNPYNETFRFFIKGAVGLTSNFRRNSDPAVVAKVDSFIRAISHHPSHPNH